MFKSTFLGVIGQWENEIIRRTRRNTLSILTYHGPDRHKQASKLYKSDVVLTTYQIITREISNIAVGKGDDMGPIGDFNEETFPKKFLFAPPNFFRKNENEKFPKKVSETFRFSK